MLRSRRSRRGVDREAARARLALLGAEFEAPWSDETRAGPTGDEAVEDRSTSGWTPGTAPDVGSPPTAPGPPADPPAAVWPSGLDPAATGITSPAGTPGRHAARPQTVASRLRAALADRLSPHVRGAMDGSFSGHHLGVLAVVLAAGLVVVAWWALSGRPRQQPVPTTAFETATSAPATPSETPMASDARAVEPSRTASSQPGDVVVVDVAGKVRHPGIVTLPAGSRVADALKAAGGARPGVDLVDLNLARVLVDGEQLLVGLASASSSATGPGASPSPLGATVNLNTADQATLETLPGIGPVTAQAIMEWRADNGGFSTVDELLEVDGIGEVTLADLRDLVTV